jgi:hypothetical protein
MHTLIGELQIWMRTFTRCQMVHHQDYSYHTTQTTPMTALKTTVFKATATSVYKAPYHPHQGRCMCYWNRSLSSIVSTARVRELPIRAGLLLAANVSCAVLFETHLVHAGVTKGFGSSRPQLNAMTPKTRRHSTPRYYSRHPSAGVIVDNTNEH